MVKREKEKRKSDAFSPFSEVPCRFVLLVFLRRDLGRLCTQAVFPATNPPFSLPREFFTHSFSPARSQSKADVSTSSLKLNFNFQRPSRLKLASSASLSLTNGLPTSSKYPLSNQNGRNSGGRRSDETDRAQRAAHDVEGGRRRF